MKGRWRILLAALGGLTLLGFARPLRAQNTVTRLWEDTRTHQVFTEPGRHRVPFNFTAEGRGKDPRPDAGGGG